jgi:hypothetical protein
MPEFGDETNMVVNILLVKRRRLRTVLLSTGALFAGMAALIMLNFGGQRQAELSVMGPTYTPRPIGQQAPAGDGPILPGSAVKDVRAAAPQKMAGTHKGVAAAQPSAVSEAGPKSRVELVVGVGADAKLWVDGQAHACAQRLTLELSAGKHVLMVKQGGTTEIRKLSVTAGTGYRVEFGEHGLVYQLP